MTANTTTTSNDTILEALDEASEFVQALRYHAKRAKLEHGISEDLEASFTAALTELGARIRRAHTAAWPV
jgi:hypothetical protein